MDDIEAIRQLKARYFRTMDTKDWDGMRGGVHRRRRDGHDRVGRRRRHRRRRVHGVPAGRCSHGRVTVHHGHMPEIELTSRRTATGIWALHDIIIWPTAMRLRRLRPLPRDLREGRRRRGGSSRRRSPACTWTSPTRRRADARRRGRHRRGVGLRPGARRAVRRAAAWTSRCSTSTASAPSPRRSALVAGPRRRGARAARRRRPTPRASTRPPPRSTERFGRADLVVSNVGVQLFGAVERFTDDEWRWVLDVNVIGSARVARAFLPLLRRAARRTPGVHDVVVGARPGEPAGRLPGEQVRGVGPGRDAAARARRRRHRRVGDLPVGDDDSPPRDSGGRPARPPPPAGRRRRRPRPP